MIYYTYLFSAELKKFVFTLTRIDLRKLFSFTLLAFTNESLDAVALSVEEWMSVEDTNSVETTFGETTSVGVFAYNSCEKAAFSIKLPTII